KTPIFYHTKVLADTNNGIIINKGYPIRGSLYYFLTKIKMAHPDISRCAIIDYYSMIISTIVAKY
ncbi:MAG: hypothetical protein RR442_10510, partial [Muribaculaceae bacterium]